ncbi:MAG: ABC transporter ATP-binding protein [Sphingobacteriia bacterium]|nr:ABC transporter ATP-binding protein [Sphingobacteriia bacterium]
MIALNDLSFEFGGRWLYRDVNWHIKPKERIGLIGKNGTGKSTLLRILTGEYTPAEGNISRMNTLKIGFLNQDLLSYESEESVHRVAMEAFEGLLKVQSEIDDILQQLETDYSDNLIARLGHLQQVFEAGGGYEMEFRTHEVLAGLGFSEAEQERPLKTFSGGWRMRVMLAKILLAQPDLLLLDEPTNHLDLPSILWLETYLQNFEGAFIIVSHDRYFLDRVVTRIVEVRNSKLNIYSGNYSFYLEERALREEVQKGQYENQQRQIREAERFIERFKAKASKATQAQSRVKMLEKMDRVDPVEPEEAFISFSFKSGQQAGVDIVTLKEIDKQYPDKTILKKTEATIRRGDKIALIGANGLGKSTVLRILAGAETFSGERKPGYNVVQSFYAQHQVEALTLSNNILEEMSLFIRDKGETYVRNILGCFLFSGDDVQKKIKVLSGGEKSRVALAKTLLSEANFLLLDEPTNHLDMQSIQILMQALVQFNGTYVVVSHDRFFLDAIANKIWYIEDYQIKEYPGTYAEFEAWYQKRKASPTVEAVVAPVPKPVAPVAKPVVEQKGYGKNEIRRQQQLVSGLETRIQEAEKQLQIILEEHNLPEVAANFAMAKKLGERRQEQEKILQGLTQEWEEALEKLEEMETSV